MQVKSLLAVSVCGFFLVAAGCRKTNHVDRATFKSAINHYLSARDECVWSASVKFPAQATTSNDDQTKGYDALTDAGFLTRRSAEKKRFTPSEDTESNHYTVNYHYDVASVPGWASTTEMKTAFPKIAADTSGQQMGTATLVKSSDGWQVSGSQP